jgi:hypothetical protein
MNRDKINQRCIFKAKTSKGDIRLELKKKTHTFKLKSYTMYWAEKNSTHKTKQAQLLKSAAFQE